MTGDALPKEQSVSVEDFLRRFFGDGNDAGAWRNTIRPFLDNLRSGTDAPIVLPRYQSHIDDFTMYVIARSPAEIAQIRELIRAFAGPSYSTGGDNIPTLLDPQDPVDAAVIEIAWPSAAFKVRTSSNKHHRANLRTSLELMQSTVARRPSRSWAVARPLGRLLAEFEAALAAGGVESSKSALEQIAARGGISATNLAHLRIKRLDRLGLSRELLALDGLAEVLRQDPPHPVKEAVLNAVHSTALAGPLSHGDTAEAYNRLRDVNLLLPVKEGAGLYGDEAVTVLLTAAVARGDIPQSSRVIDELRRSGRVGSIPKALWEEALALMAPSLSQHGPTPHLVEPAEVDQTAVPTANDTLAPDSWDELFKKLALGRPEAVSLIRSEGWSAWPSPSESDEELSHLLASFDDLSWSRAWMAVGAVIEALGQGSPAPDVIREFITYALTFEKFSPGELVTLQALTEIFLRSAPSAETYRSLLEELRDSCAQWVSPENAIAALDFADRLVLSACPDESARLNLAVALLTPLHRYQARLEDSVLPFARQLSKELGLPLDWGQEETLEEDIPYNDLDGRSVLLYSLDEAVLARTAGALERRIPGLRITLSHDKVGSIALKQKARNANVVVLATRCAKHAATGFIIENAKNAEITYAEGSGSASLFRAAMTGLLAGR
ncbi:hypothetical protein DI270_014545 [Microbispora triticiradicis]|uniref:Uncharacterized protein n=1 Tax=Microbispora triticiradicis TaxID=2200763 RepID=A0ABX9LJW2_9ACTN|nr:protein DpdD [Microbispora triticiradicis]RGA04254.1 hypothetical protein DI270_014545 [Microbispora triticiradicis]